MARQGQQPVRAGGKPARPATKEQALQDMAMNDPEKAAQALREILKNK